MQTNTSDGQVASAPGDAPAESETVAIGIAEYAVTDSGTTLTTSGLGSCLGIALYDEWAEVAGLIHVMLPEGDATRKGPDAKFVDAGVDALVEVMVDRGANVSNLSAKVVGGSEMLQLNGESSVGSRNVQAARDALDEYGVPIEAADVGGSHGRSVKFDGETGDLRVKTAYEDEEVL